MRVRIVLRTHCDVLGTGLKQEISEPFAREDQWSFQRRGGEQLAHRLYGSSAQKAESATERKECRRCFAGLSHTGKIYSRIVRTKI